MTSLWFAFRRSIVRNTLSSAFNLLEVAPEPSLVPSPRLRRRNSCVEEVLVSYFCGCVKVNHVTLFTAGSLAYLIFPIEVVLLRSQLESTLGDDLMNPCAGTQNMSEYLVLCGLSVQHLLRETSWASDLFAISLVKNTFEFPPAAANHDYSFVSTPCLCCGSASTSSFRER